MCDGVLRDAMMKRSGNGLLRREMKIRVVTQTRSGVSYLPTWGQWPIRGAARRCLIKITEPGAIYPETYISGGEV